MKKVAGVILAVGVLASTGTIFANSDAGTYLTEWYKDSLQKQSDDIVATSSEKLTGDVRSFKNSMVDIQKLVSEFMNDFTDNVLVNTKSEMDKHQKYIEEQLEASTSKLQKENLDSYSEEKQNKEKQAISEEADDILAEVLKN